MTQPNLIETIEKALSEYMGAVTEKDLEAATYEIEKEAPEWLRALLEENKRLAKENVRLSSPLVESLNYEKGQIDMRLSGVHAMNMLEAFVDLFETNGGKNFLTTTLEAPARNKRYEVTITNLNGELSSAEKMNQLVSELSAKDKVLEWYADDQNYIGMVDGSSNLHVDGGLQAKDILSQYPPRREEDET